MLGLHIFTSRTRLIRGRDVHRVLQRHLSLQCDSQPMKESLRVDRPRGKGTNAFREQHIVTL